MAHHPSARKRMRSDAAKRLRNRYQKKTCLTAIKSLRSMTDPAQARLQFNKVAAMLDKLGRKGIFHRNKSAHLKSSLAKGLGGE